MVDANIPDIALEPDKTVKKVSLLLSFESNLTLNTTPPSGWVYE